MRLGSVAPWTAWQPTSIEGTNEGAGYGFLTGVKLVDGGYGYNLKYTRRLLHCVRNDSKGGLEA